MGCILITLSNVGFVLYNNHFTDLCISRGVHGFGSSMILTSSLTLVHNAFDYDENKEQFATGINLRDDNSKYAPIYLLVV